MKKNNWFHESLNTFFKLVEVEIINIYEFTYNTKKNRN